MAVPAGYVVWIKPLNDCFRGLWVGHLRDQQREHSANSTGTAFAMRPPSRETVIKWMSDVGDRIPTDIIRTGFRKCMLGGGVPAGDPLDEVDRSAMQVAIENVLEQLEKLFVINSDPSSTLTDKDDIVDSSCPCSMSI